MEGALNITFESGKLELYALLSMDLLRLDRISEAQAAELLQLDRWALLDTMGRYRVPAIRMSSEELRRELAQEIKQSRGI